jgi:hypothetical protein
MVASSSSVMPLTMAQSVWLAPRVSIASIPLTVYRTVSFFSLVSSHKPLRDRSVAAPERGALPCLYIGRHSPQPQGHVERIDAECGPEGMLADPMLFCVAGGAQRYGVAIVRLHPYTPRGSGSHLRRLRRRCLPAGDARELTAKRQVLHPPTQVRLGLAARYGAGGCGGRTLIS